MPAPTLEGYLFPETYFLDRDATEEEILRRMVAQFHSVFVDSLYGQLDLLGISLNEAVTLASIVELEAQAPCDHSEVYASAVGRHRPCDGHHAISATGAGRHSCFPGHRR